MAKNEKQKASVSEAEPETKKKEAAGEATDATQKASGKVPRYDVRFGLFPQEGSVKGICSVTIGGEFCVRNVRLVEGTNGLFISMPSYKSGEEYRDIFFPVTREARASLQEAVINEYELQMQIHRYDVHQGGQAAPAEAPKGAPMNSMA